MATIVTYNGKTFTIPATGEENWGGTTKVDGFLVEVANNALSKAGGLFTLSGDLDFGATAGLAAVYYKSRGSPLSSAGIFRMAKTESIGWRNNANSGNNLLATDTSDNLTYNGTIIASSAGVVPVAAGGTGITSYTAGDILYATGATTLAKRAIGGANTVLTSDGSAPQWAQIVNANVSAAAAIAYSKLSLTGSIMNADVSASAAIALSKLAALTTSKAVVTDGSGVITTLAVTSTELGFVAGLTSSAVGTTQTQSLSGKTFTDAVTLTQIATPANPSAGLNKLYTKSGNTLCWLDSGGTEHSAVDATAGGLYTLRNFIINGNFDFWQRGTSFATIADGTQVADRFTYFKSGTTAVHTVSRDSSVVPTLAQSGFQTTYSLKVACTTADAAVAAGDLSYIRYSVEGYDYASLKNRTVTLVFWVYSTKTGTSCVSFRNSGNDKSYVVEFTINTTLTWEKKTITLTLDQSGGTEDYANGNGLKIGWTLIGGSTFQTTANAWQSGNFHCTSNQVNHCDNTANVFNIAQVQLIIGSTAPSAFTRAGHTLAGEYKMASRYYCKSFPIDTAPAQNIGTTGSVSTISSGAANIAFGVWVSFPSRMRAAPTVTTYSPDNASANWSLNAGSRPTVTVATIDEHGVSIEGGTATAVSARYNIHFSADAELT